MARPGAVYPQATLLAALLADRPVTRVGPGATVREAWQAAQRAGAAVVVLGRGRAVRREELERACAWGLGSRPAAAVAWHEVPQLRPGSAEPAARRALATSRSRLVLVAGRSGPQGAIDARRTPLMPPAWTAGPALDQPADAEAERRLWLLRTAGKLGEAMGLPVYAVGGVVRDLLLGRSPLDVDLVVEGDAVALARRLAEDLGGRLVAHRAFGTAAIEHARTPDGLALPRLDLATARREEYARPGALPVIQPAPLAEDLARRDFSVNALALALAPGSFGRLLDPVGGRRDLEARRLRPLHPLSFVEDPTRVVRAARYGARLGLTLDGQGRRALALALAMPGYPGLSAARLRGELAITAADPAGWRALADLARWGGLGLLHRGLRASAALLGRLRTAATLAGRPGWPAQGVDRLQLALALLLLEAAPGVRRGVARRLGLLPASGPLLRLPAEVRRLRQALSGRPAPSRVARALRAASGAAAGAAWVVGGPTVRRRLEWYWTEGHAVRPELGGTQLLAAGIPAGPAVGACLEALRDARLDGRVRSAADERAWVERWRRGRKGAGR